MVKMAQMEDKDFNNSAYFDLGVHEVAITGAETGKNEKGTPYIDITVEGLGDEKDTVRMYTSENAAPYTRNNLAKIAVHNRDSEEEKQKVRDAFKKITDSDQMDNKFLERFIDMQAWLLVEEDQTAPKPNGGFYKRSTLYAYKPTPKAAVAAVMGKSGDAPVDLNEIPF